MPTRPMARPEVFIVPGGVENPLTDRARASRAAGATSTAGAKATSTPTRRWTSESSRAIASPGTAFPLKPDLSAKSFDRLRRPGRAGLGEFLVGFPIPLPGQTGVLKVTAMRFELARGPLPSVCSVKGAAMMRSTSACSSAGGGPPGPPRPPFAGRLGRLLPGPERKWKQPAATLRWPGRIDWVFSWIGFGKCCAISGKLTRGHPLLQALRQFCQDGRAGRRVVF